jgi:hypothetical protein
VTYGSTPPRRLPMTGRVGHCASSPRRFTAGLLSRRSLPAATIGGAFGFRDRESVAHRAGSGHTGLVEEVGPLPAETQPRPLLDRRR